MRPKPPSWAAALLLCLTLSACGEQRESANARPVERRIQVEAALRPVIARAPAELRTAVTYVDSLTAMSATPDPAKVAMVVLAARQVPVLSEDADGVSEVRAVASDQFIAIGRADGPKTIPDLPADAAVGFQTAPRTVADEAGDFARGLFGEPGPGGTEPLPEHVERTYPSAAATLGALRGGDIDAAMVLRSALGGRASRAYRRLDAREAGFVDHYYQVATVRPTTTSRRLRRWLLSSAGQAAFRAAGFAEVRPPA